MAKKKKNFVSDWSEAIMSMKYTEEHYYLKEDTEQKQPYKVTSVQVHFNTGQEYVNFYPIRVDDTKNFILEKDEFLEKFILVKKEV